MISFSGEDAFDDFPVVIGQLLNCIDLPGCDHCGNSLIAPCHYFGDKWKTLPSHLRAFVEEHWPEVTPLYCRFCRREKYCSATCQSNAWDGYHQILCPSVNSVSNELYDIIDNKGKAKNERDAFTDVWAGQYSPIILVKIWGSIVAEAKRQMKQDGLTKPSFENWAHAKMPFRKYAFILLH